MDLLCSCVCLPVSPHGFSKTAVSFEILFVMEHATLTDLLPCVFLDFVSLTNFS